MTRIGLDMTGEGRALKGALLTEYGHFADKRIKNIDRASRFIIDDRDQGGLASDGHPFGWFCEVLADVLGDDKIRVTLQGQIPQGDAVQVWMTKYNAQISRPFYKDQMTFEVGRGDAGKLSELADAFISIVKPPARYEVASYKYACPRVAAALERLHEILDRLDP
ncbi:MAG: hypothetical protein ABSD08_22635 [Xanthobacteraceae bacterium]|jgi:hypothetical protein